MGRPGTRAPITFDSEMAFQKPGLEFINILHPLIRAIVDEYSLEENIFVNAQHIFLTTDIIPPGFYFFFVFRFFVTAAKGGHTMEFLLLDKSGKPIKSEKADRIFANMLEKGEEADLPIQIGPDDSDEIRRITQIAEDLIRNRMADRKKDIQRTNDLFVNRRLVSLQSSYDKNIAQKEELLAKAERELRTDKYITMLRGRIRNLNQDFENKRIDLEDKRIVSIEYTRLCTGVLEVL
jgi:hypothetical protein